MKVESISNNNKTINFKAGKVRVFSDFDKTFLPARHAEFQFSESENFVNFIKKYFADFTAFLNRNKNGMKFSITTGRTFGEFQKMGEISKERGFKMPFPDTLICKNGSDEYPKIGTDEEYYNGGKFPFSYDVTNKEKEQRIKEFSGWDGPKLIEKMKELYKSMNFTIVEGDSEHGVKDYDEHSLFSQGKLRDERGIVYQGTDKSDWNVGFRKDGNCKIFVTYPYDMFNIEERANAHTDLTNKINKIFKDAGVTKYFHESKCYPHECGGRPYDTWEPAIMQNKNECPYSLNKFYDTSEAVNDAKKNNDLVIVAGDSSNDTVMLDVHKYVKELFAKYNILSTQQFDEQLRNNPEFAEEYKKIPFIGIVVKPKYKESKLQSLIDAYGQGEYRKIIAVEEGHLEDGIKEAIKLYSEQNPEYKAKLSSDSKEEVYSDINHSERNENNTLPPNNNDNNNNNGDDGKKSNKKKYILAGIITAVISAITVHIKRKNMKNNNSANISNVTK
ncbi:MAG: hypothetical protein MJ231_03945 [bacterium]|nr:hypothetical protein [bacterium]